MDQEKFDCLVRISQQISNIPLSGSTLRFKKQLHKFLEKLKSGESLKQQQYILICYLHYGIHLHQQAINNPINHKCSVQQQIITVLLRFFEIDQPQSCDSQALCETIVNYLKTVFQQLLNDEYFQEQLINFISLIFWKKKIFEMQHIEINELEIAECHQKINIKVTLFSNKSLQQLLKDHLLQYADLQKNLLLLPQAEAKAIVLELSTFYFSFPEQMLCGNIMVENKNKLLLLTFGQQISFFLSLQQLDNEKLDIITQLIFQNSNIDISTHVPDFIYIMANSRNLDFDRAIILLRKMAKSSKYELNYELLRGKLIATTDRSVNNFIIDSIKSFEKNQDDILKQEISKYSNPPQVIHLVIQLLSSANFDYLYEKLLNKSISPYQYLLLHILIIVQDKPLSLNTLQDQCLKFQLNEISLVQIFSLYSFQNLNQKRKIKLLAQFQQIIETEGNLQFYDVLSVVGQDTTQQPVINHRIGAILNKEWNNISNFLKQIAYKKQAQILQGFYYVVMYFTDQNESEFLRLFDIVHKSMCTRNKVVNYTMLVNAIQQYEQGKIETEIQLYVMLLKINYILSDNVLQKKKLNEEISERSSEMGDLNEEQEHHFYQQIQEHGIKLIHQFENKIKLHELTYLGGEEKIHAAVEITRLMMLSDIKINVIHSLTRDERVLAIINEPNLIESDVIWESLKKYSLVSLATSIIQIFKNEKILKLIKMMIVELSKLCKYRHYPLLWKQYDILYTQQNQLPPLTKINILQMIVQKYQKILSINDNYEFLKLSYQQVQNSQLEHLGLLIAISLSCGITNNFIQGLGQVNDFCINKLIVQFSNSGLLQLVLTLVKPIKSVKKRKGQMDVEKKLEDYLNNQTQDAINIVIIGIQKDLNKNQDLKQEFINLANKVYLSGSSSDYPLIFDLFDRVPQELAIRCLNTITDADQNLEQKLQHIITLINKCEKYTFPVHFYEHSYQIIINNNVVSQITIDYCFLMINMIKLNETRTQSSSVNVDVTQLKEILVPEDFVPTGCTLQNNQQQLYICLQCVNANKRNVVCCASCAFSCHNGHQIEYEGKKEANCECNQTKKCNQQRQQQMPLHQTLRRDFIHSYPLGSNLLDFRLERERINRLKDHLYIRDNAVIEYESEADLEDSFSSSQFILNEESNKNLLEKSDSSNSLLIIEQNQFEEKQLKRNVQRVEISSFFSNLKINFEKLLEKLVKMCHFAFQSCAGEHDSKVLEEQEFDLPSKTQFKIEKTGNFASVQNNVQLRTDIIDIYDELKKSQEMFRQRLQQKSQFYYLPFHIRKLIDEGEGNIAIVHQNQVKLFNKIKLIQIAEKKNNGQLQSATINFRFPITSLAFNPFNQKQIMVCGQQDLHIVELKDATQQSNKPILTRIQQIISKNIWLNGQSIAWVTQNQIGIFNFSSNTQSSYLFESDDQKIKDFCVVNKYLLCIDFNGNIYYSKLQTGQAKVKFTEKVNLENHVKGKSKDAIPYCLACIPNTSILLVSYKNGASFLCNFDNGQFINIFRLDELLASQQLDGLLSCPQLIHQNKNSLKIATLAQKQNFTSQQLNFHQGRLLIIEINRSGVIYAQQVFDAYLDSYQLIKGPELYALGLQDNKQMICTLLNFKDQNPLMISEKKNENQDQLFNSIKERFDTNLLKQGSSLFLPLQNFCLRPSTEATPQQLQLGATSITVSQGYAITGLVFHQPTSDSVEIFKYRTIHKKNNMIIVPFNYLEQIYTFLHHNVTFTQNNYNDVQVYIQKMSLSQTLMMKILQILSQEVNTQKEYVFQDLKQRYHKLKSFISEPLIGLVNSLDCLGITLQAYNDSYSTLTLVPKIVQLIQNNQPVISESAKKLLKVLLKNQKTILGGEYDYKSIKDRIFIERIKNNLSEGVNQILRKLCKIASTRLPQLFYVFNQIPNIIFDLLTETTNYKPYSQILLRYLQFLLNCQKDTTQILQQIEDIKSQWKIKNQNQFNRIFIDELLAFQKSLAREVVEYAWNVFPQETIQNDRIEVEQSEDINKSSPYVDFNFDEIGNDFGEEYELEAIMIKQEMAIMQKHQQLKKRETVTLQFPPPKPAKQLIIEAYDVVKAYVKWLCHGIKERSDSTNGAKELQLLILLIKQFYMVIKASKKVDFIKEYLSMINLRSRNIQSLLLLTFINGKNAYDDLWNAFNRYSVFLDLKEIFDCLKTLNMTEIQSKTKQKGLPLDKFRDILKSESEQQYSSLVHFLDKRNQLYYLQVINYLLGAAKISVDVREKLQTTQWAEIILQGKLNPQLKAITGSQQKQLLQQIISNQDYHRVKDINLYKSQINELQRPTLRYADRQLIFQALERIHKACRKRPQIWKEYCVESVLSVIKSQLSTYPKETLEIIEVII